MHIIVILDGIAEDHIGDVPTTLEISSTPFLDKVAQKATCGLFSPVDSALHTVKTELVIASLLGIRPQPWPGRAYFEVLYTEPDHEPPLSCAFIRYRGIVGMSAEDVESWLMEEKSIFVSLARSSGVQIVLRPYQRTASSHLIWRRRDGSYPSEGFKRIQLALEEIRNILPKNMCVDLDEDWFGDPIRVAPFSKQPCFIAHMQNATAGLCQAAGIEVLPSNGHPLDFDNNRRLFQQIKHLLGMNYKCGVIYCKSTDWASHSGDKLLKKRHIEFIDYWLGQILSPFLDCSDYSILIISDHRTNIGSEQASVSDSLFNMNNNGEGAIRFCEEFFEAQWGKSPLSLESLHNLFFYDCQSW